MLTITIVDIYNKDNKYIINAKYRDFLVDSKVIYYRPCKSYHLTDNDFQHIIDYYVEKFKEEM